MAYQPAPWMDEDDAAQDASDWAENVAADFTALAKEFAARAVALAETHGVEITPTPAKSAAYSATPLPAAIVLDNLADAFLETCDWQFAIQSPDEAARDAVDLMNADPW